jgi:hypothetical protein
VKVIENEKLMKSWDYKKNNELKIYPEDYTCGSNKKVYWKCKKGHGWETSI